MRSLSPAAFTELLGRSGTFLRGTFARDAFLGGTFARDAFLGGTFLLRRWSARIHIAAVKRGRSGTGG